MGGAVEEGEAAMGNGAATAMRGQMEEGEVALGVAAPAFGLTATFDNILKEIGFNVNQPLPHVRRRQRTVVHDVGLLSAKANDGGDDGDDDTESDNDRKMHESAGTSKKRGRRPGKTH